MDWQWAFVVLGDEQNSAWSVQQVYTCNVTNGKEFLPLHIAAMSTKCPHNTVRVLRSNFEQSVVARTSDGSMPLHLVNNQLILNVDY